MRLRLFTAILVCASAALVHAHEGPRIWIGNVEGRITTFRSDNDLDPTVYWPCRLFSTELEPFFNIYTTEFPGYEVRQVEGNVASGATFGFNIVGPALFFDVNTATFVMTAAKFGPPEPGPVPQIAISLGSNLRSTGSGPVTGFSFFTFHAIGDHSHLSYTLLGDGVNASDGPAGVYAIQLELKCTSLTTSAPYYLLVGKDVEPSDPTFVLAYEVARATLIGPGIPGDMNCDGKVDPDDLPDFVAAVLQGTNDPPGPDCCSLPTADMNGDTLVDGRDVVLFVMECLVEP